MAFRSNIVFLCFHFINSVSSFNNFVVKFRIIPQNCQNLSSCDKLNDIDDDIYNNNNNVANKVDS